MAKRKRVSDSVKKAIKESNQEVYTDLEPNNKLDEVIHENEFLNIVGKKWKFKNPNRKILIGRSVITQEDLDKNQSIAEYLINKGLSDLICFE